jgi:hypothetical protein
LVPRSSAFAFGPVTDLVTWIFSPSRSAEIDGAGLAESNPEPAREEDPLAA